MRLHVQRGRRLALHDHRLVTRLGALAGLEAQAGVEAREALCMGKGRGAPLLVVHEQDRGLGEQLGPRCKLAHDPQRQRHPALHVDSARPGEAVALPRERTVGIMRDNRVEVSEQQHSRLAASPQPAHEVARVFGRGALQPLDLNLRGQKGGRERHAFLGPFQIARRRRHPHQGLELALGGERHPGCRVDHSSGAAKW